MAEKKMGPEPEFAAFVGIDWADRKHVWCLQAADSRKREAGELEHKVEEVEAWVAELCRRFDPSPDRGRRGTSEGSSGFSAQQV